ncbi:MAG: hypothetical protein GX053_09255 [Tissierella sp.]|nr:hypothetical protein [Tissierella sp.]
MRKGKRLFKAVLKAISRVLKKVMVVVGLTLLISVLLSNFVLNANLETVLEYAGVLLMAIGGLSVLGGRRITMSGDYMWSRATAGIEDASMKEMDLFMQSYEFCIFMGLAGFIVILIGLAVYYI